MEIIICTILLICKSVYSELQEGECLDEKQNKICCAMYDIVDGKCVECTIGTFRLRKHTQCVKCPEQFYGKRCLNKCDCNDHQVCDAVDGTCYCKDTENNACTDKMVLPTIKQAATESGTGHNITMESDINATKEPISRRLLLYGLPSVLSAALIIAVGCIIKRQVIRKSQRRTNQQKTMLECEYGYAVIDESKIGEHSQSLTISHPSDDSVPISSNTIQNIHRRRDVSSSDNGDFIEEKTSLSSDNYLDPVPETGQLSNCSDESTAEDKPDANTYLHPYNTLSPDRRSHTHVYNGDEQGLKSEGYLNPYQPLQEKWQEKTHVYNTAKTKTISTDELKIITNDLEGARNANDATEKSN